MGNQDKIFEQFKSAAQKAEAKDFDALEKVWSRVDAKLDTKVLKKQNNNWKKLTVAASVVVLTTILYPFLKPNDNIISPKQLLQNKEVLQKKQLEILPEEPLEIVKENKEEILEKQISSHAESVAIVTEAEKNKDRVSPIPSNQNIGNAISTNHSSSTLKGNIYEARGVRQEPEVNVSPEDKKPEKQVGKKNSPLVVVNGEAITQNQKAAKKALAGINDEDIESVVELKEPLYIINGAHYSEESLFGKNPTSPYAPLDQQEITETVVLQGEEAIEKYGEKGKKGVVIITTKTGKPAGHK